MKILVVEDNEKNVIAAKEAAAQFSNHEFQFVANAEDALTNLDWADGVITDCFLPKASVNHGELWWGLRKAVWGIDAPALSNSDSYRELCKYVGELQMAKQATETLGLVGEALMREGKSVLPYGLVIMTNAHRAGKKTVMITDLHRHATNHGEAKEYSGYVLLPCLADEGILTVEDIKRSDGPHFVGSHVVGRYCYRCEGLQSGKEKKEPWTEAIKRLLSQ